MSLHNIFGIASLILAIGTWLWTDAALYLAYAALIAALLATIMGHRLTAALTFLIIAVKTFFVVPTLWSMLIVEGTGRGPSLATNFRHITFMFLLFAPLAAIAITRMESRLTQRIVAILTLAMFGTFLGLIAWKVPQGPLLLVFGVVFLMAVYDFWLQLSRNGNGPSR